MKKKEVKSKQTKVIPYLDYMCLIGQTVQWNDIVGNHYVGKLISMDENFLASVKLEVGGIVQYQC